MSPFMLLVAVDCTIVNSKRVLSSSCGLRKSSTRLADFSLVFALNLQWLWICWSAVPCCLAVLAWRLNVSDCKLIALRRSDSVHSFIERRGTESSELSTAWVDKVLHLRASRTGWRGRHDVGDQLAGLSHFLQSCLSHFSNGLNCY